MSDEPYPLDDVVSKGQRRASPTQSYPSGPGSGGGGGGTGLGDTDYDQVGEEDPLSPDGNETHPCDDPEKALDWNADAAAADTAQEFERRAAARNPPETLATREWGAALFQMPDGRVVAGNITSSVGTFIDSGPSGRVSVGIDWTAPAGGVLIGMIHRHNAGSHLTSGSTPTSDDQDNLRYIGDVRSQIGLNPDQARLYITALTTGPEGSAQYAKINVYNRQNQQAAINGVEGPEVNPEAQSCP